MKFSLLQEFAQNGPLTVHINSDCMCKIMPKGSNVRLEKNAFYWPGEVIAFRRGREEIVSHRFLGYLPGRRGWLALTRADNATQADSPVLARDVLGKVTRVNGEVISLQPRDWLRAQTAWFVASVRLLVLELTGASEAQNPDEH